MTQHPLEVTEAAPRGPSTGPRPRRRIHSAVVLAVGSELTSGTTRDTNGSELAEALTAEGVEVLWIALVPDRLELVVAALDEALRRADLVLLSGGLGPTPDDLTREAIAAVCGETPTVDRRLEAALRRRWLRRGLPYPTSNVKQAWLIPSARPIPNPNGTAPGWWVERPDGRLVVALPGPPRELRPMWADWVLGRLRRRGLGAPRAVRTLRTFGIGESQLVELLGADLLGAENPSVATYARSDAVDVVIVARDERSVGGRRGRSARALLSEVETRVRSRLGDAIWGIDGDTWPSVLGRLLRDRRWRLASHEAGTAGTLVELLEPLLVSGDLVRAEVEATAGDEAPRTDPTALADRAEAARTLAGAELGLAVALVETGPDSTATIAIADPAGQRTERRLVFGTGAQARLRAAVTAAAVLRTHLLAVATPEPTRAPSGT